MKVFSSDDSDTNTISHILEAEINAKTLACLNLSIYVTFTYIHRFIMQVRL